MYLLTTLTWLKEGHLTCVTDESYILMQFKSCNSSSVVNDLVTSERFITTLNTAGASSILQSCKWIMNHKLLLLFWSFFFSLKYTKLHSSASDPSPRGQPICCYSLIYPIIQHCQYLPAKGQCWPFTNWYSGGNQFVFIVDQHPICVLAAVVTETQTHVFVPSVRPGAMFSRGAPRPLSARAEDAEWSYSDKANISPCLKSDALVFSFQMTGTDTLRPVSSCHMLFNTEGSDNLLQAGRHWPTVELVIPHLFEPHSFQNKIHFPSRPPKNL